MTTTEGVDIQVLLSNADTEATTWSIADTDSVANLLQKEIYGITSNEQRW